MKAMIIIAIIAVLGVSAFAFTSTKNVKQTTKVIDDKPSTVRVY